MRCSLPGDDVHLSFPHIKLLLKGQDFFSPSSLTRLVFPTWCLWVPLCCLAPTSFFPQTIYQGVAQKKQEGSTFVYTKSTNSKRGASIIEICMTKYHIVFCDRLQHPWQPFCGLLFPSPWKPFCGREPIQCSQSSKGAQIPNKSGALV